MATPANTTVKVFGGNVEFSDGGMAAEYILGEFAKSVSEDPSGLIRVIQQDSAGAEEVVMVGGKQAAELRRNGSNIELVLLDGSVLQLAISDILGSAVDPVFTRYIGVSDSNTTISDADVNNANTETSRHLRVPTFTGEKYIFYLQPASEDDVDTLYLQKDDGDNQFEILQKLATTKDVGGTDHSVWVTRETHSVVLAGDTIDIFKMGDIVVGTSGQVPISGGDTAYLGAFDSMSSSEKAAVDLGQFALRFNNYWFVHSRAEARRNAPGVDPTAGSDVINGWQRNKPLTRLAQAGSTYYETGDEAIEQGNIYKCAITGSYTSAQIVANANGAANQWRNLTAGGGGGVDEARVNQLIAAHTDVTEAHQPQRRRHFEGALDPTDSATPIITDARAEDWYWRFYGGSDDHKLELWERRGGAADVRNWVMLREIDHSDKATEDWVIGRITGHDSSDAGAHAALFSPLTAHAANTATHLSTQDRHSIDEFNTVSPVFQDFTVDTEHSWVTNPDSEIQWTLVADLTSIGSPTFYQTTASYSDFGSQQRKLLIRIERSATIDRQLYSIDFNGDVRYGNMGSYQRIHSDATYFYYARTLSVIQTTGSGTITFQKDSTTETGHYHGRTDASNVVIDSSSFGNIPTSNDRLQDVASWIDSNWNTGSGGGVLHFSANAPAAVDGSDGDRWIRYQSTTLTGYTKSSGSWTQAFSFSGGGSASVPGWVSNPTQGDQPYVLVTDEDPPEWVTGARFMEILGIGREWIQDQAGMMFGSRYDDAGNTVNIRDLPDPSGEPDGRVLLTRASETNGYAFGSRTATGLDEQALTVYRRINGSTVHVQRIGRITNSAGESLIIVATLDDDGDFKVTASNPVNVHTQINNIGDNAWFARKTYVDSQISGINTDPIRIGTLPAIGSAEFDRLYRAANTDEIQYKRDFPTDSFRAVTTRLDDAVGFVLAEFATHNVLGGRVTGLDSSFGIRGIVDQSLSTGWRIRLGVTIPDADWTNAATVILHYTAEGGTEQSVTLTHNSALDGSDYRTFESVDNTDNRLFNYRPYTFRITRGGSILDLGEDDQYETIPGEHELNAKIAEAENHDPDWYGSQSDYDALPSSKTSDGRKYWIT